MTLADTTANPAPLGLLGFGMTTIVLNLHNSGFIGLGAMILAGYEGLFCGLSAFYAAMAQILNELYGRKVLPL